MKNIRNIFWCLALALTLSGFAPKAMANIGTIKGYGEDPFPNACVLLEGVWSADDGERYKIVQKGCKRLVIRREFDGYGYTVDIVPGSTEPKVVASPNWILVESYRWSPGQMANSLLATRTYTYTNYRVLDEIRIEKVAYDMIRETHTMKATFKNGTVRHDIRERFLKRFDN